MDGGRHWVLCRCRKLLVELNLTGEDWIMRTDLQAYEAKVMKKLVLE